MGLGVRVLNSFCPGGGEFAHQKIAQGNGQAWNRLIHYSSMFSLKKFISEIVPLWLKNRNQCVKIGGRGGGEGEGLMRGVDYTREAYTWSNIHVKENVSLSVERLIHGELYRQRNMVFLCCYGTKLPKELPLITDYNSPTENVSMVPA